MQLAAWIVTAALGTGVAAAEQIASTQGTGRLGPTGSVFPDLSWPTLCWFAAVAVLAIGLRLRAGAEGRNLDALVLAGSCLLLTLRDAGGEPGWGGQSAAWWGVLGLTLVGVYWLVRAGWLVVALRPIGHPGPVSAGTQLVLAVVGLALAIHVLTSAPLSGPSLDGLVGGLYTAETGALPYGDTPGRDGQSPLVYFMHAGAVRLLPPAITAETGAQVRMTWGARELWLNEPWAESGDLGAARLVNAVLFILLVLGLFLIGSRLRGEGSAATLVTLCCVYPGVLECLPRPDIMLPAVLLTWTAAFALLPALGGVLATLSLVLAGVAWPWAWLGLPVLLAWCWRRSGGQVLGSVVGLLGGAALVIAGTQLLVRPALPREGAALATAGLQPVYEAELAGMNTIILRPRAGVQSEETASRAWTAYPWKLLVRSEHATLQPTEGETPRLSVDWPPGVDSAAVLYRQIAATPEARAALQPGYRRVLARQSESTQLAANVRTLLEATWWPERESPPPGPGAWDTWAGASLGARFTLLRRLAKVVLVLVVVWATLAIYLGRRNRPRHLLAGLLVVAAGTLLASAAGATTYLVWLAPLVATMWAINEPPEERPAPVRRRETLPPLRPAPPVVSPPGNTAGPGPAAAGGPAVSSLFGRGPAPRITVEPAPPPGNVPPAPSA